MCIIFDTDCLNFLLNKPIGRRILRSCEIKLPPSIMEELGGKEKKYLEEYDLEIIEMEENERKFAAKKIQHLNQQKIWKKRYLENPNQSIRNKGECEAAAIARRLNGTLVLLDTGAFSVMRRAFQHSQVNCVRLPDFCREFIENNGSEEEMEDLRKAFRKIHINI